MMYGRIDTSFFFHDGRFIQLSVHHKLMYLAYWMLAVELRREVLPPGYGKDMIRMRVGVSKYCAKTFEDCLRTGENFNPEPLLEFSPNGYIKVCGVRSKHAKLTWNDADDKAWYAENFSAQDRIGEERRVPRPKKRDAGDMNKFPKDAIGLAKKLLISVEEHFGKDYGPIQPPHRQQWGYNTTMHIDRLHRLGMNMPEEPNRKMPWKRIERLLVFIRTDEGSGGFPGWGKQIGGGANLWKKWRGGTLKVAFEHWEGQQVEAPPDF